MYPSSATPSVFLNVNVMARAPAAVLDPEVTLGMEDTSSNTVRQVELGSLRAQSCHARLGLNTSRHLTSEREIGVCYLLLNLIVTFTPGSEFHLKLECDIRGCFADLMRMFMTTTDKTLLGILEEAKEQAVQVQRKGLKKELKFKVLFIFGNCLGIQ